MWFRIWIELKSHMSDGGGSPAGGRRHWGEILLKTVVWQGVKLRKQWKTQQSSEGRQLHRDPAGLLTPLWKQHKVGVHKAAANTNVRLPEATHEPADSRRRNTAVICCRFEVKVRRVYSRMTGAWFGGHSYLGAMSNEQQHASFSRCVTQTRGTGRGGSMECT